MSDIREDLDNERFDKHPTQWATVITKYNPNEDEDIASEMNEWLSDSDYTTCDECDTICNSEAEVYWKGYDFVFTKEDKENIECLCDQCYNVELSEKRIEAYLA